MVSVFAQRKLIFYAQFVILTEEKSHKIGHLYLFSYKTTKKLSRYAIDKRKIRSTFQL